MSSFLSRRLARATSIEAPSVSDVNMQVRTGCSVPFQPHMLEKGDTAAAPTVDNVNMQVRTGCSVPFASFMVAEPKPAVEPQKTVTARAKS
jgi:hypothetical protein